MPEFPAFGGAGQPAVDNALRMLFQPDRERAFLTVSSVVGGIFMTLLGVYLYPQGLTPDFFPNTHLNATSLGLPVTSPADFWELRDLHRRQADELVLLARFAPRFGLILNWVHLMSSKSPTFLSPRLFLPAMFVPRIIITLHIIVFAVSNPFFVFAVSRLLCHFTLVEVKSVHATFKVLDSRVLTFALRDGFWTARLTGAVPVATPVG